MSVICKKCFIGQQAEDYIKLIEKNKAAMPRSSRADDIVIEKRITVCENCEYLVGATCSACGCYVELRALRKSSKCPNKKWSE